MAGTGTGAGTAGTGAGMEGDGTAAIGAEDRSLSDRPTIRVTTAIIRAITATGAAVTILAAATAATGTAISPGGGCNLTMAGFESAPSALGLRRPVGKDNQFRQSQIRPLRIPTIHSNVRGNKRIA